MFDVIELGADTHTQIEEKQGIKSLVMIIEVFFFLLSYWVHFKVVWVQVRRGTVSFIDLVFFFIPQFMNIFVAVARGRESVCVREREKERD